MKSRFDLEEAIMNVQATESDLQAFLEMYMDRPEPLSEDQVANYIMGIQNVLNLRCEKLWETFCAVFELDHHAPERRGFNE